MNHLYVRKCKTSARGRIYFLSLISVMIWVIIRKEDTFMFHITQSPNCIPPPIRHHSPLKSDLDKKTTSKNRALKLICQKWLTPSCVHYTCSVEKSQSPAVSIGCIHEASTWVRWLQFIDRDKIMRCSLIGLPKLAVGKDWYSLISNALWWYLK